MTSLLTAYYSAALLFLLAHSTHIGLPPALQAKEEETSQQIAALSAELKKTQWEKTVIEQRAETLSTALAVRASTSSKVHCHSLHSSCLYNLRCCSSHLHPQDYGSCTLAVDLQHVCVCARSQGGVWLAFVQPVCSRIQLQYAVSQPAWVLCSLPALCSSSNCQICHSSARG